MKHTVLYSCDEKYSAKIEVSNYKPSRFGNRENSSWGGFDGGVSEATVELTDMNATASYRIPKVGQQLSSKVRWTNTYQLLQRVFPRQQFHCLERAKA